VCFASARTYGCIRLEPGDRRLLNVYQPLSITVGLREDYGDSLLYVSQQLRLLRCVPLHSRLWAGFAECQRAAEPAL
jgi:hypothetical protein